MERVLELGERARFRLPGGHVVSVSVMELTVALAADWLKREHPNNRTTLTVAQKYQLEMMEGGWRASPEPIVHSMRHMIDGGNRCRAVVESGRSIIATVWFDWPEEVFEVLNRGKMRTVVQASKMAGDSSPKVAFQMARVLAVLDNSRLVIADSEIRHYTKNLLPVWNVIGHQLAGIKIGNRGLRVPVLLTLCVAWMSEPRMVEAFIEELRATAARERIPSPPVRNFVRWYENSVKTAGGYTAAVDNSRAAGAALRQFCDGSKAEFIKPSPDSWNYWRNRPSALLQVPSLKDANA